MSDWMDDLDWQPIGTYTGETFVMLREAGGKWIFGQAQDDGWAEMIDGDLIPVSLDPVEWAPAPEDRWASLAM